MIRRVAVLVGVAVLAICAAPGVAAPQTDPGDIVQIYQVQATFDRAASANNLDLMMSLWADDATLSVGDIHGYRGKSQIRGWFATRYGAFTAAHWIALTVSPTIRVDVRGPQANLYFESYYVDLTTMEVKAEEATTATLAQVNGKWLIKDALFGGLTAAQLVTYSPSVDPAGADGSTSDSAPLAVASLMASSALGRTVSTAIIPGRALGPVVLGMPATEAQQAAARFEHKTGCNIDLLVTNGVVIAAGTAFGACLDLQLPTDTRPIVESAGPFFLALPAGIGGPPIALVNAFGTPIVVRQGADETALIFANGLVAHVGAVHTQGGVVTYLAVQAAEARSVPQIGHFAADAGVHVMPSYSDGGSGDGFGPAPTSP